MKVLLLVALVCCHQFVISQNETVSLNEIESKLKNKSASVSSILSDKNYLSLHPLTPFRELIKKYCTTDHVKITTDAEPGKKIKANPPVLWCTYALFRRTG